MLVQGIAEHARAMLARVSWLVSRRGVLRAGLAVPVVAACQRERRRAEPPVPGAAHLDTALADEDRLLAAYDQALASPTAKTRSLQRLRDDHAEHRAALVAAGARVVPSPTPTGPPASTPRPQLAAMERAASAARLESCLAAPRSLAPLFGSLAASEAAHAVSLNA
ncbi:MAG: hypothetical protein QOG53_2320 [Frankiales bacterium]|nr:hypothetical protein [Frankiales bacterium]